MEDGATWLKSTEYGDDKDRVLIKSDGNYTYLTPDIAYHHDKFERGFEVLIDILGPDHHGYISRLKASQAALGHDPEKVFAATIPSLASNVLTSSRNSRVSRCSGMYS